MVSLFLESCFINECPGYFGSPGDLMTECSPCSVNLSENLLGLYRKKHSCLVVQYHIPGHLCNPEIYALWTQRPLLMCIW